MIIAAVMFGSFVARSVVVDGVERKYQIWVPAAYDASRKWPAILFLHGSGERGSDGVKQTTVGLGPALAKIDVQAIVVFPQCPENDRWVGRVSRTIAIAALDAAEGEFKIDEHRVALTGMSMGGAGAWYLAAEYPKRWSAIAPVCGYVHRPPSIPELGDTTSETFDEFAKRLPHVPIWVFHGSDDTVVPVQESREMSRALAPRAGYTEFAHTGHNAWDPAYQQTHVVQWLVEQRRK